MPQVIERQDIGWILRQSTLVSVLSVLGPLQIFQQVREIHPKERLSPLALHRLFQVLESRPEIAALVLQQSQVVMGCRVGGLDRQDRTVTLPGLVQLTLLM